MNRSSRVLLVFAVLAALPALAGAHTWSGAVNGNWSNAGNWSAGGAPVNSETNVALTFPNAQSNMGTMNNDLTGLSVTSIAFHDTAYVLGGNGFSFAGAIAIDNGTANAEAMINVPIALTGDAVFQVSGNPDFWLGFGGVISGAHNVTVQMASPFSGTPIVSFDAANTYTGTTTVSSAYLRLQNAQALGGTSSGTVITSGSGQSGTITLGSVTISGEALTIAGSGQNGNGALQLNTGSWLGAVTLTGNTYIRGDASTIGGVISGAFNVDFSGTSITLTQANTYSGTTTIDYGSLYVNGSQPSSAVSVSGFSTPNSTLGGTGTVGAVSMGAGPDPKIVDPGPSAGTGILSTGNLSLNDTANGNHAKLHVDLNGTTAGTQYDQVSVTGTVDVTNATLEVALGYAPALGDTFTIVSNDGTDAVTGTFAGLPQGATFVSGGKTFQISYTGGDGNDITLTVTSLTPVALERFSAE